MNVKKICKKIENTTIDSKNIKIDESTYIYDKSNPAEELFNYSIVEDKTTEYTILKFKTDNNISLAECRFCLISDNIGYIHTIEVDESIQNNNIGTEIIKYSVDNLSSESDVIYIYPTNKIIKHICDSQGFKETDAPSDWYCKA
jgi:N-acetylglutamate synthase-like GNAT family acetyltransferase